jgi:hypothetical protein
MKALAQIGAWHNSLDRMPAVILVSPLLNYLITSVVSENSCHFVNLHSFASSSFFLSMRKIT